MSARHAEQSYRHQAFVGTIGTADRSGAPFGYWKIGATTWTIGAPSADGVVYSGSGRIKIDFGTGAFNGTVFATGSSADDGAESLRVLGNNSASRISVLGGRVGVATNLPGETATSPRWTSRGSNAVCNLGPGVTWTTANVAGGGILTVNSGSSGTLSAASGASVTTHGSAAIATINVAAMSRSTIALHPEPLSRR